MSEEDSARLLAELTELRAQANALSTRLSANHDPRMRYTSEDLNSVAQVTVDSHGRATEVVVRRDWRHVTDPAGLARALVEATDQAQTRRLEAWATGSAPAPRVLLAPAQAAADWPYGTDLIRALLPLLDAAEARIDVAQHQLEKHFTEKTRYGNASGVLTITTQGGRLSEIEFDERWIASASAEEVARQVRDCLQDAHDRTWTGIGDFLPRELRELMSLTADPERMLRQLGLRD